MSFPDDLGSFRGKTWTKVRVFGEVPGWVTIATCLFSWQLLKTETNRSFSCMPMEIRNRKQHPRENTQICDIVGSQHHQNVFLNHAEGSPKEFKKHYP